MAKDVLVYEEKNVILASSLDVAKRFNKKHDQILKNIDMLLDRIHSSKKTSEEYFKQGFYFAENGQKYRFYVMTEKGFSLLAMGFTGDKAFEWKLKYIDAFEMMKKAILERQSIEWQEQRAIGKKTRKAETEVLKKLVEYAKEQGSENAEMYYMHYSKLVKKLVGDYTKRDFATLHQLEALTMLEKITLHCVSDCIELDMHYKEIYKICKRKLETYISLTYFDRQAIM